MQVFKTGCKVFLRHPIYLVIYILVLSMFGLFLVGSLLDSNPSEEYQANLPVAAVIDRDSTELTEGLASAIEAHAQLDTIEDSKRALQDASAQGFIDYILIIPESYTKDYFTSLKNGTEAPQLETVRNYVSVNATQMDQIVNQYLALVGMAATADPQLSEADLAESSLEIMAAEAQVEVIKEGEAAHLSDAYVSFLRFSAYPLTVGIIVCVATMMAAFNKAEIRRRNLASPLTNASFSFQTSLACVMVALFAWLWINVLAFVAFGNSFEGVPIENILLITVIVLAFVTVPLAMGYLFTQLGLKENVANAAGNILAMLLSFLGGAWMDPALLGEEVTAVAHFVPSYWYAQAIAKVSVLTSAPTSSTLLDVAGDIGIILLFALAIFVIALVAGRMRVQTNEAGGNTAAARPRV